MTLKKVRSWDGILAEYPTLHRYGYWVGGDNGTGDYEGEFVDSKTPEEATKMFLDFHPEYCLNVKVEKTVIRPGVPSIAEGIRLLKKKLTRP